MDLVAIKEDQPGDKWRRNFLAKWPVYRSWFLGQGIEARPSAERARRALAAEMPEILPVYDRLCGLVGDDDVAHRFLTFYCPPPLIQGCSVAVAPVGEPTLLRNYDFWPDFFEATVLASRWRAPRRVIAVSEGFFGALDGMNDDGLVVALTYGGRPALGEGFGIPLLLRYVLECCATTAEAVEALTKIPCATVQNVMVLDRAGSHALVFLSPDRAPVIRHEAVTTNHQERIESPEAARWSQTRERADHLRSLRRGADLSLDQWVRAFHAAPLYRRDYAEGLGTLYTATFQPSRGLVEYGWPDRAPWVQSFDSFSEGSRPLPP